MQVGSTVPVPVIPINSTVIENSSPRRNDLVKLLAIQVLVDHQVLAKILQKGENCNVLYKKNNPKNHHILKYILEDELLAAHSQKMT